MTKQCAASTAAAIFTLYSARNSVEAILGWNTIRDGWLEELASKLDSAAFNMAASVTECKLGSKGTDFSAKLTELTERAKRITGKDINNDTRISLLDLKDDIERAFYGIGEAFS